MTTTSLNNVNISEEQNRFTLLSQLTSDLATAHTSDKILTIVASLAPKLGYTRSEISLLTDQDEAYFQSSQSERNELNNGQVQQIVEQALQPDLPNSDTQRSFIDLPSMRGVITLTNPHLTTEDQLLLDALAAQTAGALERLSLRADTEHSIQETNLMFEVSKELVTATKLQDIYAVLIDSIMATEVDRAELHICHTPHGERLPRESEIVYIGDNDEETDDNGLGYRFDMLDYPSLEQIIESQESLVIEDLTTADLSIREKAFFTAYGAHTLIISPLIARRQVAGLLFIQYRTKHPVTKRELTLFRTLCNQTTIGLENARQIQRTEIALAETQTLYRAGRVLARATDLQDILEEALIEFLYSLELDQGGITMLNADRTEAHLAAYVQDGLPQDIEKLNFPIAPEDIPYQKVLLSGQPFVSVDALNDPRLANFKNFNPTHQPKSLLQAPMIMKGETIGWIGADAVREKRDFPQREIDLARAMADQITIAIENRRLLEETQRRAEQLKAVAQVGESVSEMTDLVELLRHAVDLIRDRFGFYHVSIFLIDDQRKWAVVRASTGEVGQIMINKPHKLEIGGSSIVGYVTSEGKPRIALDVGADAVWFNNPLLPKTRSEMALPMIARGREIIGALDVQSTKQEAFSDEDIEILQIMANQITAAVEKAHLFEQTESNQRFLRAIINQIPDPVYIKDEQHRLQVINRAFAEELAGQPIHELLGQTDEDIFPPSWADESHEQDERLFATGESFETEQIWPDKGGRERIVFLRKAPLMMSSASDHPDYLIGLVNDITERKMREEERETLIENTRQTLKRTQGLYQISHILDTSPTPRETYEGVLGQYLSLLSLEEGSIHLLNPSHTIVERQALYQQGVPTEENLSLTLDADLAKKIWPDTKPTEPIKLPSNETSKEETNSLIATLGHKNLASLLIIPLLRRVGTERREKQLVGLIAVGSPDEYHIFAPQDLEVGETIAGQLSRWLENRQLLIEAQYRTEQLQTASEVSRAASSILDIDDLIETSVNLIRDRFGFYYVGLFLVEGEWAVLKAGTGEAGQRQLAKNHKLKLGGTSMIGWSIVNQEARIALDVGQDAVRFVNPDLPKTRSEMALPLNSRGQSIGALTVQSEKQGAFSTEDVTLLQTMADQLANAIENANLFSQTQHALAETERLYQITQELLSAEDEEKVYRLATHAMAQSGIDMCAIYIYELHQDNITARRVGAKSAKSPNGETSAKEDSWLVLKQGWSVSGELPEPVGEQIPARNNALAQLIPDDGGIFIFDQQQQPTISSEVAQTMARLGLGAILLAPLATSNRRLGFLLVAYQLTEKTFNRSQQRYYNALAQQMVVALENLSLLQASQKRARREQIIREISGRIRNSNNVNDILKTTLSELSKVVGANRGRIALGVGDNNSSTPSSSSDK